MGKDYKFADGITEGKKRKMKGCYGLKIEKAFRHISGRQQGKASSTAWQAYGKNRKANVVFKVYRENDNPYSTQHSGFTYLSIHDTLIRYKSKKKKKKR